MPLIAWELFSEDHSLFSFATVDTRLSLVLTEFTFISKQSFGHPMIIK